MTQEQFKKAVNDRESQIKNLQIEIQQLKETYSEEHSKFEVGEKVIVIEESWNGITKENIGFISKIWISSDGKINYNFHKAKKDGTASYNKLYVGYKYEVKKLNSDQNVQVSDTSKAK